MNPRASVPRHITLVAPPQVTLQDLTGPYEVFSRAALRVPGAYEIQVAAGCAGRRVRTKFGLEIVCDLPVSKVSLPVDTLVLAGSQRAVDGPEDPRFLAWLRKAAAGARRTASVCVGAFHLGQAGLLKGRRATTHWAYLTRLRDQFPDAYVDDGRIYTRDGALYTSAGITAGIDLALALVEEDLGAAVAQSVARELVVFLQRPSDQPQLSAALALRMAGRDPIRHVQQWVPEHLDCVRGVEDMAQLACMSLRNFSRLFRRETGATPAAWLRSLRVEMAQRRLQESSDGMQRIAKTSGYGSERTLRRSLKRAQDLSPSSYRRRAVARHGTPR